jgi:hypothetical protein
MGKKNQREEIGIIPSERIASRIFVIRGKKVNKPLRRIGFGMT